MVSDLIDDKSTVRVNRKMELVTIPKAAGAAALLLTWGVYYGNAKYLGTNDVKYILIRGAVRDESVTSSGSEEFPNNIWGYGRLNLINSFLELRVT